MRHFPPLLPPPFGHSILQASHSSQRETERKREVSSCRFSHIVCMRTHTNKSFYVLSREPPPPNSYLPPSRGFSSGYEDPHTPPARVPSLGRIRPGKRGKKGKEEEDERSGSMGRHVMERARIVVACQMEHYGRLLFFVLKVYFIIISFYFSFVSAVFTLD